MFDRAGPQIFGTDWEAVKRETVCVDVTNVADWLFTENEQEEWRLSQDYPSLLSPWPKAWYEYRVPRTSNSNGELITLLEPGRSAAAAALVSVIEIPPEARAAARALDPLEDLMGAHIGAFTGERPVRLTLQRFEREPRWMVFTRVFAELDGELQEREGLDGFYLDEKGFIPETRRTGMVPKDLMGYAPQMLAQLNPVWFAVSLLACKNVGTQEHVTPAKVAKKRLKSGKEPGVTYHTLLIDPARRQLRGEGKSDETGLKRALHLCRGSFATYTAEKPLFGHYVGTVWRPAHAKGAKSKGEVRKDYVVGRP